MLTRMELLFVKMFDGVIIGRHEFKKPRLDSRVFNRKLL